ncbi:MAG: arsenate reductase family protein [Bacteroidia bacterium]
MSKLFHLSNCSTCQRIIKELELGPEVILQEIKTEPITEEQIEEMQALAGSYEALFSRRAMKYRAMGLHEKELSEADYKSLILEEYTFLKRPVLVLDGQIFVGNTKKVVAAAKEALHS